MIQVDELRRLGVSDHRIAVGGHSYGAFMATNLLAHTAGLFVAGIGRSVYIQISISIYLSIYL